jgi:hypothetical protein
MLNSAIVRIVDFCAQRRWQVLVVGILLFLGTWIAVGGAQAVQSVVRTRTVFWLVIAYLVFAFVVTTAIRSPGLGNLLPPWRPEPFDPNDKTNLAPYRIVHLLALAVVVTRFLPVHSPILRWRSLTPLIKCAELAPGILRRHRSFVLRPHRDRAERELALGSDSSWGHRRATDDDGDPNNRVQASFACPTWRRRVRHSTEVRVREIHRTSDVRMRLLNVE